MFTQLCLPLSSSGLFYTSAISAGFPLPGDEHHDNTLDLNEYLIQHPGATLFILAADNSMQGAGIFADDLLIVNRSLTPTHNRVVVVETGGETNIRRLQKIRGELYFLSEPGHRYSAERMSGNDILIKGVVTTVIHFL